MTKIFDINGNYMTKNLSFMKKCMTNSFRNIFSNAKQIT